MGIVESVRFSKTTLLILIVIIAGLIVTSSIFLKSARGRNLMNSDVRGTQITPQVIKVGDKIKVKYPVDYTIVMVGDSMTEALGNSDELMANLKRYYPGKTFQILNYGFGSTNILSIPKRLTETTFYTRDFSPITDIEFNLILVESMGHNPLSELPLDQGLQKQTETLDNIISIIKERNSSAKVAFVSTIAPSKYQYGKGKVDLPDSEREAWANERIAYIKNHMDYARAHNIPLINVFEKSLNKSGDANLDFINKDDYIHPSPNGIYSISDEIAKFIFENNLLTPN